MALALGSVTIPPSDLAALATGGAAENPAFATILYQFRLPKALTATLARYVDPGHRGWHEQLDRSGRVTSDAMNATSVYHVTGALLDAADALEG